MEPSTAEVLAHYGYSFTKPAIEADNTLKLMRENKR